jgi:hypothetical protein
MGSLLGRHYCQRMIGNVFRNARGIQGRGWVTVGLHINFRGKGSHLGPTKSTFGKRGHRSCTVCVSVKLES